MVESLGVKLGNRNGERVRLVVCRGDRGIEELLGSQSSVNYEGRDRESSKERRRIINSIS